MQGVDRGAEPVRSEGRLEDQLTWTRPLIAARHRLRLRDHLTDEFAQARHIATVQDARRVVS